MNNFPLQNNPDDLAISIHISNLILFFSKAEVRAAVYLWQLGLESKQHVIIRHLNNIALTYSVDQVNDILKLFNIDDKNLDMSQDDKAV